MNLHIQIYNDKGEVEHSEKSIEDMIEYLQVLNSSKPCPECNGNKTSCNCVKDKAMLGILPDKGCEYDEISQE